MDEIGMIFSVSHDFCLKLDHYILLSLIKSAILNLALNIFVDLIVKEATL